MMRIQEFIYVVNFAGVAINIGIYARWGGLGGSCAGSLPPLLIPNTAARHSPTRPSAVQARHHLAQHIKGGVH